MVVLAGAKQIIDAGGLRGLISRNTRPAGAMLQTDAAQSAHHQAYSYRKNGGFWYCYDAGRWPRRSYEAFRHGSLGSLANRLRRFASRLLFVP
jgi:hypothetical protein